MERTSFGRRVVGTSLDGRLWKRSGWRESVSRTLVVRCASCGEKVITNVISKDLG